MQYDRVEKFFFVFVHNFLNHIVLKQMGWGICAIVWMVISMTFGLSLGITAIWTEANYGDETCAHLFKYHGISFDYLFWLLVYGWTVVGLDLAFVMIGMCTLMNCLTKNNAIQITMQLLFGTIIVIDFYFQFCWFVVGVILFFYEVAPYCEKGHVIFDFGLALFIIRCVIYAWMISAALVQTQDES